MSSFPGLSVFSFSRVIFFPRAWWLLFYVSVFSFPGFNASVFPSYSLLSYYYHGCSCFLCQSSVEQGYKAGGTWDDGSGKYQMTTPVMLQALCLRDLERGRMFSDIWGFAAKLLRKSLILFQNNFLSARLVPPCVSNPQFTERLTWDWGVCMRILLLGLRNFLPQEVIHKEGSSCFPYDEINTHVYISSWGSKSNLTWLLLNCSFLGLRY